MPKLAETLGPSFLYYFVYSVVIFDVYFLGVVGDL